MDPNQKPKVLVAAIGLLVLVVTLAVFIFCVQDDDRGTVQPTELYIDQAGRDLGDAEREADRIGDGISEIQERTRRVQGGIDRAAESVGRAEGNLRTAKDLVSESRSLAEEGRRILQSLPKTNGE